MKKITEDIERIVICPQCGDCMRPATKSWQRTKNLVYRCPQKHFFTPDKKQFYWTKEEDAALAFYMATLPRPKIYAQFWREFAGRNYKRSRAAIKRRMERMALETSKELPNHVSRGVLAQGLNTTGTLIRSWELKGLQKDKSASDKMYIYYRKSELRRFFLEHSNLLSGKTISHDFAHTFVGIMSGEW